MGTKYIKSYKSFYYKKLIIFLHISILYLLKLINNNLFKIIKKKADNKKVIIGFINKKSKGWILEYLFRDLSKFSSKFSFELCDSPAGLYKKILEYENYHIFCLHQSLIKRLILFAIPPNKITTSYTHTRFKNNNFNLLNQVNKVLPLNSFEANLLKLEKINNKKIKVFYSGFDDNLFYPVFIKKKEFDIIFVGKYEDQLDSYYGFRKNYSYLISLVNYLTKSNIKVAILGNDWNKCNLLIKSSNLFLLDVPHNEYPEIYNKSKIFANVSLYEGGPVSFLEALACGCITISFPTGFPLEHISDKTKSFILPFNTSISDFQKYIIKILKNYDPLDESLMNSRLEFLNKAKFETLAIELERIAELDVCNPKRPKSFFTKKK